MNTTETEIADALLAAIRESLGFIEKAREQFDMVEKRGMPGWHHINQAEGGFDDATARYKRYLDACAVRAKLDAANEDLTPPAAD